MNCKRFRLAAILFLVACAASAQKTPKVTTPKEALGFNIGDDYQMATYTQLEVYWKKLATESDRMKLVEIGKTAEGRPHYMAIISSPENMKNLAKYKTISRPSGPCRRCDEAAGADCWRARAKAIVWIDGGLHANETVGSQQLMETVYQLVSRTDAETMRLLNDDIVLCVQANPDGQEIVADWYMREKDPLKRTLNELPRLYNKYIGHDDNRDFYMSNMPETTNMNRQLFYRMVSRRSSITTTRPGPRARSSSCRLSATPSTTTSIRWCLWASNRWAPPCTAGWWPKARAALPCAAAPTIPHGGTAACAPSLTSTT